MTRRAFWMVPLLLGVMALVTVCHGATVTWGNTTAATDNAGNALVGTGSYADPPDLSLGPLVQLWQAVGAAGNATDIDQPYGVADAYAATTATTGTNWSVDDVLLAESHIGHDLWTPPPPIPDGIWSQTSDVLGVAQNDVLYVRAYNVSKTTWDGTGLLGRELGIRNSAGDPIFGTAGDPKNPQTLMFDDLRTVPIPEPASLLFLIPGLGLWALRRKK